jgi:hypothetical protein
MGKGIKKAFSGSKPAPFKTTMPIGMSGVPGVSPQGSAPAMVHAGTGKKAKGLLPGMKRRKGGS